MKAVMLGCIEGIKVKTPALKSAGLNPVITR
jgi:hypothetical protein